MYGRPYKVGGVSLIRIYFLTKYSLIVCVFWRKNYSLIEKIKKEFLIPLAGLGIDSNHSLGNYFSNSREGFIQGNFDEKVMTQPQNIMEKKLDKFIEETSLFSAEQRVGWVCGLGHGVLKTTPEDNIRLFVRKIRESFAWVFLESKILNTSLLRKLEYCYTVCKSRFGLATEIGQNLLQNRQQFGDLFQAQNFGHKKILVLNAIYQND